jgi:hypothetical protein
MRRDEAVLSSVQPASARAGRLLNAWAATAFAAAVAVAVAGAILTRSIPLGWLALFGATVVWAEHRDRLFGDETSVSGSIVVVMAAVVAFSRGSWLFAPMFCASLAGLYWPHLRRAAWSRVLVNAASMSLAAAAAAGVFHLLAGSRRALDVEMALAAVVALAAFWVANCLILGVAVGIIRQRGLVAACLELLREDLELLPFAYLGFLSGYLVLKVSFWVGWALLVGVLALFDVVVVRRWRGIRWLRLACWVVAYSTSAGALAYSVVREHATFSSYGLLAIALGIPITLIVDRVRPNWSALGPIVGGTAVALVIRSESPLFTVIVVTLSLALPIAARRSTVTVRIALVAAAGFGATLLGFVVEAFPAGLSVQLPGALVVGLAGAIAGLLGWHLVLLVDLVGEYGFRTWRASVDLICDQALLSLGAGLISGIVGWAGITASVAGFVLALLVGLAATLPLARRRRLPKPRPTADLADDQLLDVLQSALLDLPASRLPEE